MVFVKIHKNVETQDFLHKKLRKIFKKIKKPSSSPWIYVFAMFILFLFQDWSDSQTLGAAHRVTQIISPIYNLPWQYITGPDILHGNRIFNTGLVCLVSSDEVLWF